MYGFKTSRKNYLYHILLLFIFLTINCIHAFGDERFTHLTINNGLSQSSGKAIVQDEYGYMWFGTADGLNRYDGYRIIKYYYSPNSKFSLPSNDISFLYSNPYDSVLWVGTQDMGPALYLRNRNDFITFNSHMDQSGLSDFGHITGIVALSRDTVLLSTNNRGLYIYSTADSVFSRPDFSSIEGLNNINALLRDTDGRVWLGTGKGLFVLTPEALLAGDEPEYVDGDMPEGIDIVALSIDTRGYLYIGTSGSGVLRFHPYTGEVSRILPAENEKGVSDLLITDVIVDKLNNLWASTPNGLYKVTASGDSYSRFLSNPNNAESMNDDNIISIYENRSGIIWIGTFLGGINILDPSQNRFPKFNNFLFSSEKEQNSNNVMSIVKDQNNSVWVNTLNGLFEIKEGYFTDEHSDMYIEKRFDNVGNNIHYDSKEGLFYNYSGNLYRLRNNGSTELLGELLIRQTGRDFAGFTYAITDSDGIIWFASNEDLLRFDPEEMTFSIIQNFDSNGQKIPMYVLHMAETYDGKIIMGTYYGALYSFDRYLGTFERMLESKQNREIIGFTKIFCVAEGDPGVIWIGTNCGLYSYEYETAELSRYLIEDGLSNNLVYGILIDKDGKIWCSTNFGVSVLNPVTGSFMNYTHGDGLQSNEFNQNSFYADNDGLFYMGGIDGMNIFNPLEISKNDFAAPVYIEAMEIQYQQVTPENIS